MGSTSGAHQLLTRLSQERKERDPCAEESAEGVRERKKAEKDGNLAVVLHDSSSARLDVVALKTGIPLVPAPATISFRC